MSFGRLLALADKEMRHILRDPRSLGVALLLPVVLLILYGYAINFDVKQIPLAVYDPDRSRESRDLITSLTRGGQFRIVAMLGRPQEAESALQRREVKAALILPDGFAADLAAGRPTSVQTLVSGADSLTASISLSYLEAIIQDWLIRSGRARAPESVQLRRVVPEVRIWYNEDLASLNFIVPGLVVVILMMLAALLTSQTVVREREQGTMEGLVVSPVTGSEVVLGKLLPYVGIALVDVGLVAVAGRLLFHVPMRGSALLLLALTLVYLCAALGAGMLISVRTRSQQVAFMAAFVGTLLPTLLLTGFIFPVSSMPEALQMVVQLHPATHFMVIVRSVVLKGAGLAVLWPRSLALVGLAVVLLGASIRGFKKTL